MLFLGVASDKAGAKQKPYGGTPWKTNSKRRSLFGTKIPACNLYGHCSSAGFIRYARSSRGTLRGPGSKHDWRAEMRYRCQHRPHEYCYAEPGDYQALRQVHDGGRLPVAGGRACCSTLRKITVAYQDMQFKKCKQSFSGFTAQIIQHEIDHCNGIII